MVISIDATNIKAGGGLTHLMRILENYNLNDITFEIIGGSWLNEIVDRKYIKKQILSEVFETLIKQELFKALHLKKHLSSTDIAFIPGGTFCSRRVKYVSMSQNMLVFEEKERNRFPKTLTWFRYLILEKLQVRSFKNARGIIFISEYAKKYIENKYSFIKSKKSIVIYHGISDNFRQKPKIQKPIYDYSPDKPFKLIYVSIINYYKHQFNVIEAVKVLRKKGLPIELELIGPVNPSLKKKLYEAIEGAEEYIFYRGKIPYEEITLTYKKADIFIFASTCENMPNILVEAMSAGLPILCSNYGPMPEVLRDAGIYMDPTKIQSISSNLQGLVQDPELRSTLAHRAYKYSQYFSWEKTANETFQFIKKVSNET